MIYKCMLFILGLSASLCQANANTIDWGLVSVPITEQNFQCDGVSVPNKTFSFHLIPRIISKNVFRANSVGVQLEHHFAYHYTQEDIDTCIYKQELLEMAARHGGVLSVGVVTTGAATNRYTSVSENGVTSCYEDSRETMLLTFPTGLVVKSNANLLRRLHFGACSEEN